MPCHGFLVASLVAFLGLFSPCMCNVLIDQPCPDPRVTDNFNKENLSGKWYHIKRYLDDNQAFVLEFMTCATVSYAIKDEQTVEVNNTFKTPGRGGSKDYTTKLTANAKIPDPNEPAKWIVYLQQGNDASEYGSLANLDLKYWILETDYNNYALVWTCQSDGKRSLLDAIILSRKPTLDENLLSDLHARLESYQLQPDFFRTVDQKSCSEA